MRPNNLALLIAFIGSLSAATAVAQDSGRVARPGMAMRGMGMGHDSATMAQMRVAHQLVVNHDRIKRTVTNLPDGVRTVTESDDPVLAQLIKQHTASMVQRVSAGNDPGLPMESEAVHSIFRDRDKIRTTLETTANGVIVVQTSSDPKVVAALREHASELSDLVRRGMAAMHETMMKRSVAPPLTQRTHGDHAANHVVERTDIPLSVQQEHQEIHERLLAATKRTDSVGQAARRLAAVLAPHFEREEQIALRPLGAIQQLAYGMAPSDSDVIVSMADSLEVELPRMLNEHKAITAAVTRLEHAAESAGVREWVSFARQLKHHALVEEEIYYPAALLVGRLLRQVSQR